MKITIMGQEFEIDDKLSDEERYHEMARLREVATLNTLEKAKKGETIPRQGPCGLPIKIAK